MSKKREIINITDGSPEKYPELEDLFDGSSEFQWCLHCERASKKGHYKLVPCDGFARQVFGGNYWVLCPFDDCDGDPIMDIWDWDSFREVRKDLPEIPKEGEYYPMYPKKNASE